MSTIRESRTETMKPWRYRPVEGLDAPVGKRLCRCRRAPEMWTHALRTVSLALTRLGLRTLHRLEIHGREHLPTDGSFVLVGNHSSHLDALCLEAATPWHLRHRVFAAAAADYFFKHTVTTVGAVLGVNAVPFDRRGGGAESLRQCRELLADRRRTVLILFPEGTRAQDGELGRFRSGAGRLVAGTDVPVVPCYLTGAHGAWPKGRILPRPGKLVLRIGPPRICSAAVDNAEGIQDFVGELRQAVEGLAH